MPTFPGIRPPTDNRVGARVPAWPVWDVFPGILEVPCAGEPVAPTEDPPFLTNRNPAPGAGGINVGANIAFRLNDDVSGVNLATLQVQIKQGAGAAVPAIVNGVFVAPFDGVASSAIVVPSVKGYDIVIDPTSDLALNETIVVSGEVRDNAGLLRVFSYAFNTIVPIPVPQPTEPEPTYLDIYRFIILEIRRQDLFGSPRPGSLLLKRFLNGPNEVWKRTIASARSIPDLWNVAKVRDEHLRFVKPIVGWTEERALKKITDAIDDAALRRLIAVSGRLWRTRGPEDAIVNVLQLLTVKRLRIWNWFDFRWVLDETGLGEEHDGRDPWVINLPSSVDSEVLLENGAHAFSTDGIVVQLAIGVFSIDIAPGMRFRVTDGPLNGQSALVLARTGPQAITLQGAGVGSVFGSATWEVVREDIEPDDEYRSNLRIVDNEVAGSDAQLAFRNLVKRILRIMRPVGERWDITYLAFLDRFNVEGDDLQWAPLPSGNLDVSGGLLNLTDETTAQSTHAIVPEAASWTQYVCASRIRGASTVASANFGLLFYYTDASNFLALLIDTVSQTLTLREVFTGTPTDLASINLGTLGFNLYADVFYTLRVEVIDEGGGNNRIIVFVDGAELANVVATANLTAGSVGFIHDSNARLEADDIEVIELPVDNDSLEINEQP